MATRTTLQLSTLREVVEESYRLLETSGRQGGLLAAIASATARSIPVHRVLTVALERLTTYLQASAACIHLLDASEERLALDAQSGLPASTARHLTSLDVRRPPMDRVIRETVPYFTAEEWGTEEPSREPAEHLLRGLSAMLPLVSMDRVIGTLMILYPSPRFLPPSRTRFLIALGNELGHAIEDATLIDNLRDSEARHRLLLESAGDLIYGIDLDGRTFYVSPSAKAITGYKPEEFLDGSITPLRMCAREYRDALKAMFRSAAREGTTGTLEFRARRKDGRQIWLSATWAPLRDSAGAHRGIQGTVRDVSAQKMAEDELRRRNDELAAMNTVASTLAESIDPDELLNRAIDAVIEVIGAKAGRIAVIVEGTRRLRTVVSRNIPETLLEHIAEFELGDPWSGSVAASGEPLTIGNLSTSPYLLHAHPATIEWGLKSLVSVPIRSKGRVLGVIEVAHDVPEHFATRDLELLSAIANQLGLALDNARLYEQMRRKAKEMATLLRSVGDLLPTTPVENKFHQIMRSLEETFGYEAGWLGLVDQDRTSLIGVAEFGQETGPEGIGLELPVTAPVRHPMVLALIERKPNVVIDPGNDPRYTDDRERMPLGRAGCLASLPILSGEEVLGVLSVGRYASKVPITERDIELLETFASHAAITIEGARLLEDARVRADQAGSLSRIASLLTQTLDLKDVLDQIVADAATLLSVEIASLFLFDEKTATLVGKAVVGLDPSMLEDFRIPLSFSRTAQEAARTLQPIVVHEPLEDGRIPRPVVERFSIISSLTLPLVLRSTLVGFLFLDHVTSVRRFTQRDIDLASRFAHLAAVAIGNARLFDHALRREDQLTRQMEMKGRELEDARSRLTTSEYLAWLGQLAAGLGHEIRTPLSVIKNATYYLNSRLVDADEAIRRNLVMIREGVTSSERIVAHLLDFSRGRKLTRLPVDLETLIASAAQEADIPPSIGFASRLATEMPHIIGDTELLARVLVNLFTNAVQAMPEGGALSVSAAPDEEETAVLIEISDTGEGIAPENLARVFEPLFTTRARGMGLGLALCKMLVEAHGGTIAVKSLPGTGTTFTLTLPVHSDLPERDERGDSTERVDS